jgi:hypothetical protein
LLQGVIQPQTATLWAKPLKRDNRAPEQEI